MEKGRESANKMKILALVRDYNAFKKRSVQHFRFDAKETTQSYGGELVKSTLQLVQIYFDTATFDNIERDKKIKIDAQLSLIGGTMGLLTGFSIISGVEIIFFLLRLAKSFRTSRADVLAATKKKFHNHLM